LEESQRVAPQMSHLVWYTIRMKMIMKDELFEVKIATCWNGEVYVHSTTTHIKAFDLAHAEHASERPNDE